MTQWKYEADGGSYTVDENVLRATIAEGKLAGDTRLTRVDDDSLHRVDTAFRTEYSASVADNAARKALTDAENRAERKPFFGRNLWIAVVLIGGSIYAYSWYSNRITCSRDDVTKLVREIIKEKLLKVTKGDATIYSIATLGNLDNGGVKCSADADIRETGSFFDGLHGIEYTAERRGDSLYVTSRLTR